MATTKTRKETQKIGRGFMSFRVKSDEIDDEKRTVPVVFTTGALVKRFSWKLGEYYYEELSTKKAHVRLERLNSGAPVLNAHNAWSLDDVLGAVVEGSARMVKGVGEATLRFDDDRGEGDNGQDGVAEKTFRKIKRKTINHVSVGYWTHKSEEVGTHDDGLKIFRSTDWEPGEISPVPIPADSGARVRGEEGELIDCEFLFMEKDQMKVEPTERGGAPETTPAVKVEPVIQVDEKAVREAAALGERQRAADINEACDSMRIERDFAADLIKRGVAIEEARKLVIEKRVELDKASNTASANIAVTRDENQTRVSAVENALLNRVQPGKFKLEDSGRAYRSYSMLELARSFLTAHGEKTEGLSKMALAGRAFHTTTDFPIVLANVANKVMKSEYAEAPQTHVPITTRISLADFKQTDIAQLGGGKLDLDEQGESGEVKYGTIGEAKEVIQLKTYSKGFSYTRKMLINDDLGIFNRIPGMFGRKVRKKEGDLVWGIFTGNPAMGDGTTLFHADHGNLGTAGSIGETTVSEARLGMRTQTDIDGDLVHVAPRIMIVPAARETLAQKFIQAVIVATKDSDTNIFKGAFDLIVEARLDAASATAWYLSGMPSEIDLIGLGYLDGEEGPVLETAQEFDIDGTKMKVRADMAAKALDWRGLFKNAGA